MGANNPQLKEFEQLSERAIDLIFNNVIYTNLPLRKLMQKTPLM
jgi:hypothetical protein